MLPFQKERAKISMRKYNKQALVKEENKNSAMNMTLWEYEQGSHGKCLSSFVNCLLALIVNNLEYW